MRNIYEEYIKTEDNSKFEDLRVHLKKLIFESDEFRRMTIDSKELHINSFIDIATDDDLYELLLMNFGEANSYIDIRIVSIKYILVRLNHERCRNILTYIMERDFIKFCRNFVDDVYNLPSSYRKDVLSAEYIVKMMKDTLNASNRDYEYPIINAFKNATYYISLNNPELKDDVDKLCIYPYQIGKDLHLNHNCATFADFINNQPNPTLSDLYCSLYLEKLVDSMSMDDISSFIANFNDRDFLGYELPDSIINILSPKKIIKLLTDNINLLENYKNFDYSLYDEMITRGNRSILEAVLDKYYPNLKNRKLSSYDKIDFNLNFDNTENCELIKTILSSFDKDLQYNDILKFYLGGLTRNNKRKQFDLIMRSPIIKNKIKKQLIYSLSHFDIVTINWRISQDESKEINRLYDQYIITMMKLGAGDRLKMYIDDIMDPRITDLPSFAILNHITYILRNVSSERIYGYQYSDILLNIFYKLGKTTVYSYKQEKSYIKSHYNSRILGNLANLVYSKILDNLEYNDDFESKNLRKFDTIFKQCWTVISGPHYYDVRLCRRIVEIVRKNRKYFKTSIGYYEGIFNLLPHNIDKNYEYVFGCNDEVIIEKILSRSRLYKCTNPVVINIIMNNDNPKMENVKKIANNLLS